MASPAPEVTTTPVSDEEQTDAVTKERLSRQLLISVTPTQETRLKVCAEREQRTVAAFIRWHMTQVMDASDTEHGTSSA